MSGLPHPFTDPRIDPPEDDETDPYDWPTLCWACECEVDEFGNCWNPDCERFQGEDDGEG